MIPPSSRSFLVKDLVAGREYDLCVLAVYNDGITSLTATRAIGCVQFTTLQEYNQCQSIHTQFLGGTMIIIIGGIIVASVLVFIIILMIRYKVYSNQDEQQKAKVSNVYSQTNGNQPGSLSQSASKGLVEEPSGRSTKDCATVTYSRDSDKVCVTQIPEMNNEDAPSPRRRPQPKPCADHQSSSPLSTRDTKADETGSQQTGEKRKSSDWTDIKI